jgi:hypothetical protein
VAQKEGMIWQHEEKILTKDSDQKEKSQKIGWRLLPSTGRFPFLPDRARHESLVKDRKAFHLAHERFRDLYRRRWRIEKNLLVSRDLLN